MKLKSCCRLEESLQMLRACMAALLLSAPVGAEEGVRLLAFPGAQGAGQWAKGGRGGKAIAVTNLNDSGPGSLRAAIETPGPRTVIFRVGGVIELSRPLLVTQPFLTIAGQTAPGDGICLKGYSLQIFSTHDVIVRHLRCRPGDATTKDGEMDAVSIDTVQDVIVDHCSTSWSTDEVLSVTTDCDRVTVQHCVIAEGLSKSSYGSIIASYRGSLSFLHNLYANNRARNPRPGSYPSVEGHANDPGPKIDFRNNVIFNWTYGPGYTGERVAMNYVGNYLKPGLDTVATERSAVFMIWPKAEVQMFLDGNLHEPPLPIQFQSELLRLRPGCTLILRDTPIPFDSTAETLTAPAAYARVLSEVGATKPKRDAVDADIIAGVRTGSGRRKETIPPNAWPALHGQSTEPDADSDGLPDAWERHHSLNLNDPADAALIANPDGWTHLELWLNSL